MRDPRLRAADETAHNAQLVLGLPCRAPGVRLYARERHSGVREQLPKHRLRQRAEEPEVPATTSDARVLLACQPNRLSVHHQARIRMLPGGGDNVTPDRIERLLYTALEQGDRCRRQRRWTEWKPSPINDGGVLTPRVRGAAVSVAPHAVRRRSTTCAVQLRLVLAALADPLFPLHDADALCLLMFSVTTFL